MPDSASRTDQPSRPGGALELQILLFTLARNLCATHDELFGIDVFEVREVMRAPQITRAPDAPPAVAGLICLRGTLVPVIDLARCAGLETPAPGAILIVTETQGRLQALLVHSVETIVRVIRSAMKKPPALLARASRSRISAVTALDDGRLVMMIDLEQVLVDAEGGEARTERLSSAPRGEAPSAVLAGNGAAARLNLAPAMKALES